MAFIKHGDSRINLDKIIEYLPDEERKINFHTKKMDNTFVVYRKWEFDSKEARDKALENIDQVAEARDVTKSKKAGTFDSGKDKS